MSTIPELFGSMVFDAWIKEATEERGLLNLRTTPDALQMVLVPENMEMLQRHKIFSEAETLTAASNWPIPTYGDLLFGV